ncbi:sterol carrier family protein [Streptomyces radicis]|uniref:Bacterial SCP orthologue domain-containing protein n=1 Tax=Streptomyces radicis TaxID=1750517 RepID=A0A3A9WGT6_9ACTN|nr:sterol carrier family protein [Streptomyces radicis]RKN11523.1 hypothetical protein D7319_06215 [Streptomyces radicis]RKN26458.1 hypothetical protein D7318_03445 [Streptomyces radicis]
MSAVRRKPRAYHPDRVRDALLAQVEIVRLAAPDLGGERPDVRALLADVAGLIDALPRLLAEPPPAATRPTADPVTWALSTTAAAPTAPSVDEPADPAAAVDAAAQELEAVLETGVRDDVLLPHASGPMRALDFTVTRVVALAVRTDDLARATGHPVRLDRGALAIATRVLADGLAAKAPGASTELRVPPFVAVQCLAGPRHTRGTPPNVVETDPLTWLRLATGRTPWEAATATGRLRAVGERASALASELPVMG